MMANDLNSDKVGPGMQLEELVSAYSTFIATMNSIDGPSRGINGVGQGDGKKKGGAGAKVKGKCNNCGKTGHKSKDCTKGTQHPVHVGNVDQKPPRDQSKKDWCKYCVQDPHKEEDCYTKKAGKPPHPDSKCTPAKPIQAAATGVKTTKDMSQEQLSTLFKELVAGTEVLPIGVVNAVPGVFPVAHAPTLRDV